MIQYRSGRPLVPKQNQLQNLKIHQLITSNVSYMEARRRTFEFEDFDRTLLLTDSEYFQITEQGLLGFCMPVDLDTKEVSLILPVKFALRSMSISMKLSRYMERHVHR